MVLFLTDWPIYVPGHISSYMYKINRLVKTNNNITLDTGSQVNLGLKIKLDAEQERGILEAAVLVGGTLQELACHAGDQ
jgi:hypothetical protein